VEACKSENNVPRDPFFFRTWVERYVIQEDGDSVVDSPNGGKNAVAPDSKAGEVKPQGVRQPTLRASFADKLRAAGL